jgi:hypothetical protein
MGEHTVKPGEHIHTLAALYNFFDFHSIWDDAGNAGLTTLRDNPNVLDPGDIVTIPEKILKELSRSTGQVHFFGINLQPLMLRIEIKDYYDTPLKQTKCGLEVEGDPKALTTNDDGMIERPVDRKAHAGRLVVRGSDIEIRIGDLDDADVKSGQTARLNSLGYRAGLIENPDPDLFQSALEEFQADNDIRDGSGRVTGVADKRTQAALKKKHGC